MKEQMYMNKETGSVDTYFGWDYLNQDGLKVNAVDREEVVPVVWSNEENCWIEGRNPSMTFIAEYYEDGICINSCWIFSGTEKEAIEKAKKENIKNYSKIVLQQVKSVSNPEIIKIITL